jgi:hypothetical protein
MISATFNCCNNKRTIYLESVNVKKDCVFWRFEMNKKRILFIVLATLCLPFELQAEPNLVLQCLAKEEARLHKNNDHGSSYRLNQDLLNELAGSNTIYFKKKYVDEICQNRAFSPSVSLLKLLLTRETSIFDFSTENLESSEGSFRLNFIREFQKQAPRLLVQYLAGIQGELPTSNCLENAIPETKSIFERMKYLEEEISFNDIVKDKKKLESIFIKLSKLSTIKIKCQKEFEKTQMNLKRKV